MSPKEISPEKPSCIQGQCGKVYSLRTLQNGLLSQGGGKTLPRRSLAHTGGSRAAQQFIRPNREVNLKANQVSTDNNPRTKELWPSRSQTTGRGSEAKATPRSESQGLPKEKQDKGRPGVILNSTSLGPTPVAPSGVTLDAS